MHYCVFVLARIPQVLIIICGFSLKAVITGFYIHGENVYCVYKMCSLLLRAICLDWVKLLIGYDLLRCLLLVGWCV